ncbi:AfsR/SARP family transcriptional regulator [Streptomyces spectabilis]|uniref:AfsR/SARP family transcriptional regulator n=1 Tax=Streptomyces spectabilis TaxID=68270 RepID=UPI001376B069|nr:BTAD domain-containing putative transcriptional regulator [Streptomyces spectabilis]
MRFGILGPVVAWGIDGAEVKLGGWRPRTLLARLLLDPREVVPTQDLVEAFYGTEPPDSVGSTPKTAAKLLRQALGKQRDLIETCPGGYRIATALDDIDAYRFRALVHEAERQENMERSRTLAEALSLWRGPALAGLSNAVLRAAASQWEEMRLVALERKLTADVALGRHHNLVGELYQLTERHPKREALRGLLMTALFRSGRTSEALEVYATYRNQVRSEFGVEPSQQLSQLQLRILNMDPELQESASDGPIEPVAVESAPVPPPAPATRIPANLPARPHRMIGRTEQLALIQRTLTEDREGYLPITVISGPGGYGKTTLAIEAAHRMTGDYPDSQLYAHLSGAHPQPASAGDVLSRFLTLLGVSEIPATVDAKAEVFRAAVAGKRLLIVLDDAATSAQVLPLLPAEPDCAVIVTSRNPMPGIAGEHIVLGPMSHDEASELISSRVDIDPSGVPSTLKRLIKLCGGMPLALDLVCARLVTHPHWDLDHLADRLADIDQRLAVLNVDGRDVRTCFELGYQLLSPDAQTLMRTIGYLGVGEISAWTAAALVGSTIGHVTTLLDELAATHLLTVTGTVPYIYCRVHDLVLAYARERATTDGDPAELRAGLDRAFGTRLALADTAYAAMHGPQQRALVGSTARWTPADSPLRITGSATEWFTARLPHIPQMVQRAAEVCLYEACWELAVAPQTAMEAGGYFDLWLTTHTNALTAVRAVGVDYGEAVLLHSLGYRALVLKDHQEAEIHLHRSAEIFSHLGDNEGQAATMVLISDACRLRGDLAAARTACERGFALRPTNKRVRAGLWLNLGRAQTYGDELAQATESLDQSLTLYEQCDDLRGQAEAHCDLARVFVREANLVASTASFGSALQLAEAVGDTLGMAYILADLGEAHSDLGSPEDAYPLLIKAADLAQKANNTHVKSRARQALAKLAHPRASST